MHFSHPIFRRTHPEKRSFALPLSSTRIYYFSDMQAQVALRLARQHALRRSLQVRALASTTANAAHVASAGASSSASSVTSSASRSASIIPLSNVEAQWATLSAEEKATVHDQLEVLQKKQWKELSLDEKRAGTCLNDNLCTCMQDVDVAPSLAGNTNASLLCCFWSSRSPRPYFKPR